jgi:uncharacterized membrane protein
MACVLLAGSVALRLIVPQAAAQTVPAEAAAPSEVAPNGAPAKDASLVLSASKATTFKIATVVTNMGIFSLGTASVVGGGLLTAFNVTKSRLLYTANDYAWDTYAPLPKPTGPAESFDAKASAWRTTQKFLTYKPVDTAIKFASIYLWTGSLPAMLVLGTASSVANTVVFYANNFAWDIYEWSATPPAPTNTAPANPAPAGTIKAGAATPQPVVRRAVDRAS